MKALLVLVIASFLRSALALADNDPTQVVSTHRGNVLLRCVLPKEIIRRGVTVSWISPRDQIVAVGNAISQEFHKLVNISGNKDAGEHHLLLKHAIFPDHVGKWQCLIGLPPRMIQSVNLSLHVPPPIMSPSVYVEKLLPGHVDESGLFVIFCTGHFALPPLSLTWIKKSGPDNEFGIYSPRYVVSKHGLVSVSIGLILTVKDIGSTFECSSSHPTCRDTFNTSCTFLPNPDWLELKSTTEGHVHSLGSSDKVLMFIIILLVLLFAAAIFLLHKCRNKWSWKKSLSSNIHHQFLPHASLRASVDNDLNPTEAVERKSWRLLRNKCAFCCLMLLFVSLCLALPVYFKSTDISSNQDADQVLAVFSGSALWLDCRSLLTSNDFPVIKWMFEGHVFYHQYLSNSITNGYSHNSSVSFYKSSRLTSSEMGQITIWPILPNGDSGKYSCNIFSNNGTNKKKTMIVHVLTKKTISAPLIGLISFSIACSVIMMPLLFLNCIKTTACKKKNQPP